MEIGKIYKWKDEVDDGRFPFGYKQGCFIGYDGTGWAYFMLNVEKGTTSLINATDENFELVKFDAK